MRSSFPGPRELAAVFDTMLAAALDGQPVPSCTGLDFETFQALAAVAGADLAARPALADVARAVFADQLSGAHDDLGLPSFMRGRPQQT
ncbi:hypothetical protein ACFYUD_34495 [Nocardia tengchongensis]|uniref:hypothetical protein n=1 Tax=Nocardia tengchongensis TaxID=2055889 RepID=UPI00367E111C